MLVRASRGDGPGLTRPWSAEQVKGDLVWRKDAGDRGGGKPDRAEEEDEALAEKVGKAAPEEEKAAKGERVRRHNPLLARLGNGQVVADAREENDDALDGQRLRRDSSVGAT